MKNNPGWFKSVGPPKCHPDRKYQAKGLCNKCYQTMMYRKNREARLAYLKKWRIENPEEVKRNNRNRYLSLTPEEKKKECDRLYLYYQEVRKQVFSMYGDKCSRCGFGDWRALQLDHVNGGARRLKEKRGRDLHRQILSGKHPKEKFQLLCCNCNWIKRWENGECNNKGRIRLSHSPVG